jgi:Ser/Thr protein kinase RdoA (MazF antagonist)
MQMSDNRPNSPFSRPFWLQRVASVLSKYPADVQPDGSAPRTITVGYSGAGVWRIDATRGPFALRFMPIEQVDPGRLAELHRLQSAVLAAGVPAPKVESNREGESFLVEPDGVWQLETWLPGECDHQEPVMPLARITAAVQALARWHIAAEQFGRSTSAVHFASGVPSPAPAVENHSRRLSQWTPERCRRIRELIDRCDWAEFVPVARQALECLERLWPLQRRLLTMAARDVVLVQPVLADPWRAHVLFEGDRVTGLIDPFSARCDSVAVDLARFLGSAAGDDAEAWDAGVSAYDAARRLSNPERMLVSVLDGSGTMLIVGYWLQAILVDDHGTLRSGDALARLTRSVERLRRRWNA